MSTPAPGRTRARDLDRASTSGLLDAAYAEGQLDAGEYHDRAAQAAAAKTLDQLRRLTADLQTPELAASVPHRTRAVSGAFARKTLGALRSGARYPDHTRAREVDRATTRELLDLARAEGQLSGEEHEASTELVGEARTLGDLADLVADLQKPAEFAEPRRPRSRRRPWYATAVATAAALAAGAGFLAVTHETGAQDAAGAPAPVVDLSAVRPRVVATPNLLTEPGLTTFLRDYQAEFGDMQVDVLRLFGDYAVVERAVPGQPNRSVHYDYRGGFAQSTAITTRKPETAAVDLAVLNITAIARALVDAPARVQVPDGTVSHLEVSSVRSGFGDTGPAQPTVSVYAGNSFGESGYFVMSAAGEIRRVWAFRK